MTLQSMLDDHGEVGVCKCNSAEKEHASGCGCGEKCDCA